MADYLGGMMQERRGEDEGMITEERPTEERSTGSEFRDNPVEIEQERRGEQEGIITEDRPTEERSNDSKFRDDPVETEQERRGEGEGIIMEERPTEQRSNDSKFRDDPVETEQERRGEGEGIIMEERPTEQRSTGREFRDDPVETEQEKRGEGEGIITEERPTEQRSTGREFRDDPVETEQERRGEGEGIITEERPTEQRSTGSEFRDNPVETEQERRGEGEGIITKERPTQQRSTGSEFRDDPLDIEHVGGREPPSSQVGYGGGNRTSEFAQEADGQDSHSSLEQDDHLVEGKARGGRFVGGHGHSDPRLSEDQPMMTSSENSGTTDGNARPSESGFRSPGPRGYVSEVDGHRSSDDYGTVDPNARPSESGYGSSGPGGYVGEGGPAHQSRSYGTTDANSKPSESGYGSSGPGGYIGEGGLRVSDEGHPKSRDGTGKSHPGGYTEEGGARRTPVTYKSQHYQDSSEHYGGLPAPMRPPGAVLLDENHFEGPKYENEATTTTTGDTYRAQPSSIPSDSVREDEVRGGVPHGIVSGHPSGTGQDNHGASEATRVPISGPVGHQDVEPQEYHQTGSVPRPGGSAYSEKYTQPDGPNMDASQLEEAYQQSETTPGPMERCNMAPAATEESGRHKEGLMAKIKSHFPGHHKHHAGTDVDNDHATPTTTTTENEKPGFVEKIKDKITPGHTKTYEQ